MFQFDFRLGGTSVKGSRTQARAKADNGQFSPAFHTLIDVYQRKRNDIAMPAPDTLEPSIPAEATALHQFVQQSLPILPSIKCHNTDAECSMDRNARPPSPSMLYQSAIADLQHDLDAFGSRQTQVLQRAMNAQVELETMALAIQTKIGEIVQKAKDNRGVR